MSIAGFKLIKNNLTKKQKSLLYSKQKEKNEKKTKFNMPNQSK